MQSTERADHEVGLGSGKHAKRYIPSHPAPSPTALILYGSETGNAQDLAEEVGRLTERLRFTTTVLDLDSISLRDLVKHTVIIFTISTTGQGEFPQNARRFWRNLLSSALKPGLLRKVVFTSFGLGDSSYARFNTAHRMLCGRLVQLGAQAFCERGEGNEQHPEGHSAGFRAFIVTLKEKLLETFPMEDGEDIIAEDVFLEPKWKLVDRSAEKVADMTNGAVMSDREAHEQTDPADSETATQPDPQPLPVMSAHLATLETMTRITPLDHFQDVRVLGLRFIREYDYNPGAVAVIYPKNFSEDVQSFIDLMSWQDTADQPLDLMTSSSATAGFSATPSPLRHLDLSRTTLTLRWLLTNVLDIMSIPRRSFFSALSHFASTTTEDQRYQKERLLELANPELIDELWDYTTRPKRTILEVMMDFTTIRIPWQYALTTLPIMKGRQFSIASGGVGKVDKQGRTKVELLVAIADPPSPIIKWRRRYGVCTRYITALEVGQQLSIGLQPGYLDVKPKEIHVPVVMIGPGTGLAPMRSMIQQRLLWAREMGVRGAGRRLEGDMLFFGCRSESADFFFREEWEELAESEGLTVLTAFSRDKARPRQYVQDLVREQRVAVRRALVEREGKVYVCGSSGNMPKGVREALVDVLADEEMDFTRGDAEVSLDRMEKAGRYKQETW
ncbi:hypothetical protein LTR62_002916 [Meristemomyces frigidus]|uniref:NADPH-dependent diflavin oxidoreductase 1 n=1 Tax=Meristemomyces frigidus TaxID=1508187 RepID=A0AAN7YSP3_9PEZI|nr:hypothetical protein LTR62_002916 [Meristemomyces frigidus]